MFPGYFGPPSQETEDNAYAKFWGANQVYYGTFVNDESSNFLESKKVNKLQLETKGVF